MTGHIWKAIYCAFTCIIMYFYHFYYITCLHVSLLNGESLKGKNEGFFILVSPRVLQNVGGTQNTFNKWFKQVRSSAGIQACVWVTEQSYLLPSHHDKQEYTRALCNYKTPCEWKVECANPTPPFWVPLISHLPLIAKIILYYVEAYQQSLSTLLAQELKNIKSACVLMTVGRTLKAGAGRTSVLNKQHSRLGTCAENSDPLNTLESQAWDVSELPGEAPQRPAMYSQSA